MPEITILSVNQSAEKGRKSPVKEIVLNENGAIGDTNYGNLGQQITIFNKNTINKACQDFGIENADFGQFGENIMIDGLDNISVNALDKIKFDDAILEIVNVGQKRAISSQLSLIQSQYGIFSRVIMAGNLKAGDKGIYEAKIFRTKIIVLSDRAFAGVYSDRSGPAIKQQLQSHFTGTERGFEIDYILIPDSIEKLSTELNNSIFQNYDIIITSGGTGIGPRDITVETVKPLLTKEIPGIMEMIRLKSGLSKPSALLSCGIAGVIGKTLIFTLPGSVKAVEEYLSEIFKVLDHAIFTIHGIDLH